MTGANWERTGVVPDVAVVQAEAPRVARIAALRHVLATYRDRETRAGRDVREETAQALAALERGVDGG